MLNGSPFGLNSRAAPNQLGFWVSSFFSPQGIGLDHHAHQAFEIHLGIPVQRAPGQAGVAPQVMNLALNNASSVIEYYRGRNEDVNVDIVTYGPGLHMLRADTSPVQDRIDQRKNMLPAGKIHFSACNNTKQGMEKAEGHAISVLSDVSIVPSGVVHLTELQEQGWSCVRP